MSNLNRILIITSFAILGAFVGLSIANYVYDNKNKSHYTANEDPIENSVGEYDENDPNVFIAYQDGLRFRFVIDYYDPNIIDVYVTDADGTHEFKSDGQVVQELHHTFKFELDNDLDRGFVKRQYKYLIKEYYKTIAWKFE